MEDLRAKKTLYFYNAKFKSKLARFNLPSELPAYFEELIDGKNEAVIAEIGAGPINTIGNLWRGKKMKIYASDVLQPQYEQMWQSSGAIPIVPVEYQDMEHLTYPDEFFDVVHCVNAIDHTINAKSALKEMIRICKPGGFVYLRHAPDQRKRYRGMHEWDVNIEGSECVVSNPREKFMLSEFGPFRCFWEKGEKEEDLAVAIMKKA